MEAQMYLPSYMREVAQSGNLNDNQHANYVELLADFAEKRDKEFYALRNECNELKTIAFHLGEDKRRLHAQAAQDEALLRQALERLEAVVEHFDPYMGDNECRPMENARYTITALRVRLGEKEQV